MININIHVKNIYILYFLLVGFCICTLPLAAPLLTWGLRSNVIGALVLFCFSRDS